MNIELPLPSSLSDLDLQAAVQRLARCEREATASLIGHLAELYGRRLHERAGYTSLFVYCVEALGLSDSASYDRMKAAKVVRRYPLALELLASGQLNLTTLRLLAPHLTRANHAELFAATACMRKRQVQKLVADRFPKPDVRSSVRRVPAAGLAGAGPAGGGLAGAALAGAGLAGPVQATAPTTDGVGTTELPHPLDAGLDHPAHEAGMVSPSGGNVVPGAQVLAPRPAVVEPLSSDRYRFTFTGSTRAYENLELARDLLRHAIPSGDPAPIIERALDLLVEKLVKDKFAVVDQPGTGRGQSERSRNIPADVKRAVYVRDQGRCAFIGSTGRRCGERGFVEFHHVEPYEVGGAPTTGNISLRCRAHNRYEAELFYGPGREYVGFEPAGQGRGTAWQA